MKILPESPISFESFMALALHDPHHGYYASKISAVGSRGDFTTAPMLAEAPARAISAWAMRAMKETGCHHLVEIGPGEGLLADRVLKNLPWYVRRRTRLHLVETSAPLAARQRLLLGNRATWYPNTHAAMVACDGKAVIYSNELVDAFPVRRYRKNIDGWQELAVHFDHTKLAVESFLTPTPLPDSSVFAGDHPTGQWVEVHDSYHRYLNEWMPSWKAGRLLTIDYGAVANEIYQRRMQGSIRAYLFHQRIEGPEIYLNPGRQDLTADVNFTDLIGWSRPWTRLHELMTLRDFLNRHTTLTDPIDLRLTDAIGTAFLVLDQTR